MGSQSDLGQAQDRLNWIHELRACLHEGGGPQVGEVKYGGSPHLSCKRDQIKMRDYMDKRVTPPKRVTSLTWGPPPPCKQALSNLEPDLVRLTRWGGWVGRQAPSCRIKLSKWDNACQCFLLYILICTSLINPQGWYSLILSDTAENLQVT